MTPHQAESILSSRQLILLTEQEKALSPEQNISQLFIEQAQARNIDCTESYFAWFRTVNSAEES